MIAYLKGILDSKSPATAVVECGGVGYECFIPLSTYDRLPATGAEVRLLTSHVVREDAQMLYGFATEDEKKTFELVTSVSGVGPKLALSVLSTFSPAQLATVVATQDIGRMAQVPGVGKRKGQRLLVELEGVFAKDAELRGLVGLEQPSLSTAVAPQASSVVAEATDALLSMGFSPQEAELALEGYEEAGATTIEKALSFALRRLGGGR